MVKAMSDRRLDTRDAAAWAHTLRAGERVLLSGGAQEVFTGYFEM